MTRFLRDQWISAWATGWATMALAQAVPAPGRGVSDRWRVVLRRSHSGVVQAFRPA